MKITAQKHGQMNEADRLTIATLLIKAGYTVRVHKEKKTDNKTTVISVEYWEADNG